MFVMYENDCSKSMFEQYEIVYVSFISFKIAHSVFVCYIFLYFQITKPARQPSPPCTITLATTNFCNKLVLTNN